MHLAGLIWITAWLRQSGDNGRMWTRRLLVLLMLCLPLRLWAGASLMQNVPGAPLVMALSSQAADEHAVHTGHPCHDEAVSVADDHAQPSANAQTQHCDKGDCQICSVCHMPALHAAAWMVFTLSAPKAWVSAQGLSASAAPIAALFKPPVS